MTHGPAFRPPPRGCLFSFDVAAKGSHGTGKRVTPKGTDESRKGLQSGSGREGFGGVPGTSAGEEGSPPRDGPEHPRNLRSLSASPTGSRVLLRRRHVPVRVEGGPGSAPVLDLALRGDSGRRPPLVRPATPLATRRSRDSSGSCAGGVGDSFGEV